MFRSKNHRLSVSSRRAIVEAIETRRHCDADNNITGAVDLGAINIYTPKSGSINKSTDATDFYKFTVPSGTKTFKVALTGLTNNADLYLYNSSKTQINSSKATGTASEVISKTALAAGTYYAEVRAVTGSSNYTLKAESDFTGDSRDLARDIGTLPINTPKSYNEYAGTLDTGDYYKFKIDGSREVLLQADTLSGDVNIELLSSAGTSLASSKNSGTTAEEIDYKNLAAGTYYAKVVPASSSVDAKYTMELSTFAVPTDPGGTLATAKDIGTLNNDTKSYTEKVGYSDQSDLYKFKFNKTGLVQLDLSGLSQDADLYLLDSAGNTLSQSRRSGTTADHLIKGITAGTYYVQVKALAPDTPTTPYTLKISTSDGAYDSFGNTISTAYDTYTPPPGNSVSTGYIVNGQNQDDYRKVHVGQPGNLTAFIYNLSDDLDLRIYNSSGTLVSSALSTSTSSESISYSVPSAGDYYIRVSQGISGAKGSASQYDMQFHVPSDEAGDTRALAKTVNSPFSGTGQIGGFDKYDFYKIIVPSTAYLNLSLATSDNPATLSLYDANGGLVDFRSAKAGTPASLSYFFHTGGTYYVAASSTSSLLSHYTIGIKTQIV